MYAGEESGKSCCGVMVTQTVSIRWFIVMIAFVGICCAVVGTVLGAMRSSGREHLTVSLLMIGKFAGVRGNRNHRSNTHTPVEKLLENQTAALPKIFFFFFYE
jgi:hypothetical protein